MATLPESVDYTDKDFDALRARLIALIKSVFPDWTDFDVASFGNLLVELYAYVGDVLTFYQDNLARESRLVTATQRKSVMALAKMLGYRLHGAQAATAEVWLQLARVPVASVTIPAGTVLRTQEVTEPVRFQLLAPAVIAAAADPPRVLVLVENSKAHTQLFDARGLADLELHLDFAPYLDDSAVVSTPQGAFTEVDSFLDSRPNDRHFVVAVDQNDRATLRFGNGVSGMPPSGTVSVTYKTGGGSAGNVDAERIAAALKRHQINPSLLTCEITESAAMEDAEGTQAIFERLAAVGVHLSIDDFGTGFCNFAMLRKMPAEELKIDRSFVLDLETSADARAVVDAVVLLLVMGMSFAAPRQRGSSDACTLTQPSLGASSMACGRISP